MGGEKLLTGTATDDETGSPPRGRGKGSKRRQRHNNAGITPAWAGKSCSKELRLILNKDHPRVGGEKSPLQSDAAPHGGSPPRGRGKVTDIRFCLCTERITPAWAGKSYYHPWYMIIIIRDHPRVGGEKEARDYPKEQVWGSPPRGRGKAKAEQTTSKSWRITPAWAGKSE